MRASGRRPDHQLQRLGRAAAAGRATAAIVPYYVAKAGIIALTEALALELAPDNILVNADRARARSSRRRTPPTRNRKRSSEATPLGRWGGEMEIAKAVLALLDSDFITGETIRVDGGRHLK